jgi:hypothetical protein
MQSIIGSIAETLLLREGHSWRKLLQPDDRAVAVLCNIILQSTFDHDLRRVCGHARSP